MNVPTPPSTTAAPVRILALGLVLAAMFATALPAALMAADPSPSPQPTMTPAEAACASADDLALIVGFLRQTDVSEDGVLPLLVGVIAGVSEARQLAGFVGDTYRPLVDDLVISFGELRTTIDGIGDEDTLGAKVAGIGAAITEIGLAMDALSVQLQTPCPSAA